MESDSKKVKFEKNIKNIVKETPNTDLSIIIYENNEISYLNFGKATENSVFQIASLTKAIVSIAFLELLEKNNININTKIEEFDINFLNKNFQNKITLKNLLTHTSGLKNSGKLFKDNKSSSKKLLGDLINSYPIVEPGDFLYSNNNYNILSFIIEKITNNSFENFLENFLASIGINKEETDLSLYIDGHLYDLEEKQIKITKAPNNPENAPSFNQLLSTKDMGKFIAHLVGAVREQPLQGEQPLQTLVMKKTILESGTSLSFNYENTKDGYYLDHQGELSTGFKSYLRLIPKEEFGFCILANDLLVDTLAIADEITNYYTNKEYRHKFTPPLNSDININILENLELGFYKGYEVGIVELYREENSLILNMSEINFEIKHYDGNKFYSYNGKVLVELIIEFGKSKIFVNSDPMIKINKPKFINKSKIARKLKGVYKHKENILSDIEIFTEYEKEDLRIFLYNSKEEFEVFLLDTENELIVPDYGHLILNYDEDSKITSFEEDGFETYIKQ